MQSILLVLVIASVPNGLAQTEKKAAEKQAYPPALVDSGKSLFLQNCAFCHGRDAGGGETGPDLTSSKLVEQDVKGDKISVIVRNGVPEKGMPRFSFPDPQLESLVAFIHDQKIKADSQQGGRRGVDVADLQTGNAEAGKQYFQGAGNCVSCHSATGDLAGVAARHKGLELEERLLFPRNAPATLTVTLSSGETVKGRLAYADEFTVALRDESGRYRAWSTDQVKSSIDAPADAHAKLLSQYTDDDIHNLMAFLQTLR